MNEMERQAMRRLTAALEKTNREHAEVNRKMQEDLPRFRAAMEKFLATLDGSYRA